MTGLENSLQGDTVGWLVGMLLLIMSVASWVLILWKSWLLLRASRDVSRSTAAFWQSASLADASQRLQAFDRESLVLPLIAATRLSASTTLAGAGEHLGRRRLHRHLQGGGSLGNRMSGIGHRAPS
jgi:biopolymer transport protein ExbB/TolQ